MFSLARPTPLPKIISETNVGILFSSCTQEQSGTWIKLGGDMLTAATQLAPCFGYESLQRHKLQLTLTAN
jgi:hypothetical protein